MCRRFHPVCHITSSATHCGLEKKDREIKKGNTESFFFSLPGKPDNVFDCCGGGGRNTSSRVKSFVRL